MSIIDDAIDRLQYHALACTTVKVRGAPSLPPEDAMVFPLSVAYISEGTGNCEDSTTARLLLTVAVEVHFNRTSNAGAYKELNKLIPEYLQRLAGDPTLNGNVDTIVFPVSFSVNPTIWNKMETVMAAFKIPLKFRESPTT